MTAAKKITVHVPEELLEQAQKSSGRGITETVRIGLQLLAANDAYEQLSKLKGKVTFSLNLKKLRNDRS